MTLAKRLRASTALLAVAGLLHPHAAFAPAAPADAAAMTAMPESSRFVKQHASVPRAVQRFGLELFPVRLDHIGCVDEFSTATFFGIPTVVQV